MAHPRIITKTFSPGQRIIAISDVHGHLALLDDILKKICFDPENDFIIFIGDTIENGEDSLGALQRVMALEKAGCALMLAGNWEYFIHKWFMSDDPDIHAIFLRRSLELRDYYGSSILCDMCACMGIALAADSSMAEIMPAVRRRYAEEIAYMGHLPIILDAGEFVCAHGGMDSMDKASINAAKDDNIFLKNDAFAEKGVGFERWLITGHWPVANYDSDIPRYSPHIFEKQRIVAIDGGCGKLEGAQLNALIMYSGIPGEFAWDFSDDYPRVRALDAQSASESPLHTTWNTRFVDIISRGAEFAMIRHHATGRILEVPVNRLWVNEGRDCIGGFTDYELPVEPGDMLSVLFTTSKGLFCKKRDVSGWYRGRYEAGGN